MRRGIEGPRDRVSSGDAAGEAAVRAFESGVDDDGGEVDVVGDEGVSVPEEFAWLLTLRTEDESALCSTDGASPPSRGGIRLDASLFVEPCRWRSNTSPSGDLTGGSSLPSPSSPSAPDSSSISSSSSRTLSDASVLRRLASSLPLPLQPRQPIHSPYPPPPSRRSTTVPDSDTPDAADATLDTLRMLSDLPWRLPASGGACCGTARLDEVAVGTAGGGEAALAANEPKMRDDKDACRCRVLVVVGVVTGRRGAIGVSL